jgi:PAS domain-containing protein
VEALRYQPSWSDLPVLLLAEFPASGRWIAQLGNVAVLELPVHEATLVSAVRTAVRARQRQYQLRDQIEALRQSEERFELAVQASHDAIWDLDCVSGDVAEHAISRALHGWDAAEAVNRNVNRLCLLIDQQFEADSTLARRYPDAPPANRASCESLVQHVPDRPGHDWRYAVSGKKAKLCLGFEPCTGLDRGLAEAIAWYVGHPEWWGAQA